MSDNHSDSKFWPPTGAIIGSILGIVAWFVFILLYALVWSKGFDLFQNIVVGVGSLLITGLAIGAMWVVWLRLNAGPRRWWDRENQMSTQKQAKRRNNEFLTEGQRFGEGVSAVIVLLILGFYLYHQFANTGFFTSKFGGWEVFAFYGSILLSLASPIARAIVGRRNPVRPIEAFCNLFFAFAMLYLFFAFPFNFAHFSAALPSEIRFLLAWVTNDIAKVVLVLAFLGGLISGVYNIGRYLTYGPPVREEPPEKHPSAGAIPA